MKIYCTAHKQKSSAKKKIKKYAEILDKSVKPL